jgi:hypothetical protein
VGPALRQRLTSWHSTAPCSQQPGPSATAQAAWGAALESVAEGLAAGRRWLWDEAARKVSILLAAPAAFEGEHFLQVRRPAAWHGHALELAGRAARWCCHGSCYCKRKSQETTRFEHRRMRRLAATLLAPAEWRHPPAVPDHTQRAYPN